MITRSSQFVICLLKKNSGIINEKTLNLSISIYEMIEDFF